MHSSDLTVGNLEVPTVNDSPKSGFKKFNASPIVLDSLKEMGFDVLTTANNHAYDQGLDGLIKTKEEIQKRNILTVGTNIPETPPEDYIIIPVGKSKILKIALINFTLKSNDKKADPRYLNYISSYEDAEIRIAKAITNAQNDGAECIIVFLHWGSEYHLMPKFKQRELALNFISNGADIIIGAHPHVIQPMERIYTKDGKFLNQYEEGAREHFIAYSLGNYISHQRGMSKYGMILELILSKNETGISIPKVVPHIVESKIGKDEIILDDYVRSQDIYKLQIVNILDFLEYIK